MHPGECFQRRALKYKLVGNAVLGMTVVSFSVGRLFMSPKRAGVNCVTGKSMCKNQKKKIHRKQ